MYTTDKSEDKVSTLKLNTELQHAQLELLSAHCATQKLRLRFSIEHVARYGRRDLLRHSIQTANALHEYYAAVEKHIPHVEPVCIAPDAPNEQLVLRAIAYLSAYLREQRERYLPGAAPLHMKHRDIMAPYFSTSLLDRVRIVELHGERVPNPSFYPEARSLGFLNLPDLSHMSSVTFLDVLVFNDTLTDRPLFHALAHAVQFEILGLERYTELFVRSFVNNRFHFLVPLEAHAFFLESKFARPSGEKFSVEDQVRIWAKQNRYQNSSAPGHQTSR
jgi:hypothetical protein